MSGFLERILASRRERIVAAQAETPVEVLEREAASRPPARDFAAALRSPRVALIAEFKRASPSRGPIAPDLDPAVQAKAYERGGASAISVLAEAEFFLGGADDVRAVRGATDLPLLWKDLLLDPYQVAQARACGCDAVLVIVRILDDPALAAAVEAIDRTGMTAVVEVYDERDLDRALATGPRVVGINNRDLETFEEDANRTSRLAPLVPRGVVSAGFSGVSRRSDVEAMERAGIDAVLVGECLMRAADPAATIRTLLGA